MHHWFGCASDSGAGGALGVGTSRAPGDLVVVGLSGLMGRGCWCLIVCCSVVVLCALLSPRLL